MGRFGNKRTRSGTRALIGPIMCMIPGMLVLRAELIEMNDISSFRSRGSFCVLQFAMLRAQAASAHISTSALIVKSN